MAGGGIKGGQLHGETDDFAWHVTKDPVSIHDFHATILHLFGLEHKKLTYRFQGREFRLTDVVKGCWGEAVIFPSAYAYEALSEFYDIGSSA